MKILITGGLGFQGSNLAKKLLEEKYEVVILDTFSEKSLENQKNSELWECDVIWGSITDKNLLDKTIREVDLVVHAAANIHVDDSIKNPTKYFEVNVLGTNNVAQLCKERNIPLIHISTCEVYGEHDGLVDEGACFNPGSPYAASKCGAESLILSYYNTYKQKACILRPSNVYGMGQKKGAAGAVIPIWVDRALKNEDLLIYGDGNQSREFIFIDDLVGAYLEVVRTMLSGSKKFDGGVFNVGGEEVITMNRLANIIIELCNSESGTKHVEARKGEVGGFYLNSNKFKSMVDWTPKNDMMVGLKKYIDWVKNV